MLLPPIDHDSTPDNDPGTPLARYRLAKHAVAELCREAASLLRNEFPWAQERIRELMTRLGEDRFNLVVLGQFKRGKTSLINAIIGRPLLPTGTLPVTSVITSLVYGSTPRATVRRADRLHDEPISVDRMAEYITERGNPGNEKNVVSVDVEVPVPFLRRGLRFIDTPGVGSALRHNTSTTLAFLPQADAAVFVTVADGLLSDAELTFLDAVRQHVRKLFFVVNKIDQVHADDVQEVLTYASRTIAARLGVEQVRVFPASATEALAPHPADSDPRLASGLGALERALATFLAEDRRTIFLTAILDRAIRVLDQVCGLVRVREESAHQSFDARETTTADLGRQLDALETQRQALFAHERLQIAYWRGMDLTPMLDHFAAQTRTGIVTGLRAVLASSSERRSRLGEANSWLQNELDTRAAQWLKDASPHVDRVAATMASDLRRELAPILEGPERLARGLMRASAEHSPSDAGEVPPGVTSAVAPFEPPPVRAPRPEGTADPSPVFWLPRGLAAQLLIRRLHPYVDERIDRLVEILRDTVLAHLEALLAEIDASSARQLLDERQRLERMLQPTTSSPSPLAPTNVEPLVERMRTLRDSLLRGELRSLGPGRDTEEAADARGAVPIGEVPVRFRHAAGVETCSLCAAGSTTVFDFLCQYQYAIGHDAATRSEFLAARGLCPSHTWQLEHLSSPYGLNLAYAPLLDQIARRIENIAGLPGPASIQHLGGLTAGVRGCRACAMQAAAEQTMAAGVADALERDPERAAELQVSFCLRHLRKVLGQVEQRWVPVLLRAQARRLAELAESMREHVIKDEGHRKGLMTDDERSAHWRGLAMLVGLQDVQDIPERRQI